MQSYENRNKYKRSMLFVWEMCGLVCTCGNSSVSHFVSPFRRCPDAFQVTNVNFLLGKCGRMALYLCKMEKL